MTHTPGPWTVREDYLHGQDIDGPLYDVETANGEESVAAHIRAEANAWLIAAAPDLLEALKAVVHLENAAIIGDGTGTQDALTRKRFAAIRAAITKAEGRQP